MKQILTGFTSLESAYPDTNFSTTVEYWIETSERLGQRICERKLNHKTLEYYKVKKSVYSSIIVMFLDDRKVKFDRICFYSSSEKIMAFKNSYADFLDASQRETLKYMIALNTVAKKVTYTITETTPIDMLSAGASDKLIALADERAEQEIREKDIMKKIQLHVEQTYKSMTL